MSRGHGERKVAWEVWRHFHTRGTDVPIGYLHQCGGVGLIVADHGTEHEELIDLGNVGCPGCSFELGKPERECRPIYGAPS